MNEVFCKNTFKFGDLNVFYQKISAFKINAPALSRDKKECAMIIHKFGGAAVKDAEGVINLSEILKGRSERKIVVISAFGKTTNNLEELTNFSFNNEKENFQEKLETIRDYHLDIITELFPPDHSIYTEIKELFSQLESLFNLDHNGYDHLYDQIVSFGELLSTKIVHAFLKMQSLYFDWMDIRRYLITDKTYREANINWSDSEKYVKKYFDLDKKDMITQGFIGGDLNGNSTTLGREGSDYTAAVLGYFLNADQVIIWKDVPGVLNADPRFFQNTRKLDKVSYQEAIELAYYGAKIIHPKTIKPLKNKNIPLMVYSFVHPDCPGTVISEHSTSDTSIPVFIVKEQQMLISISPRDFSFIFEEQLSNIYQKFAEHRVKVNLMQNSAITFTVSVDKDNPRVTTLIDDLKQDYRILYNEDLELITIRHYTEDSIREILKGRKVLVEQRSRHTAQFILETGNKLS